MIWNLFVDDDFVWLNWFKLFGGVKMMFMGLENLGEIVIFGIDVEELCFFVREFLDLLLNVIFIDFFVCLRGIGCEVEWFLNIWLIVFWELGWGFERWVLLFMVDMSEIFFIIWCYYMFIFNFIF